MADKDLTGPTGSKSGRGGYLEYNEENFKKFDNYFSGHLPGGMTPADLTVLSTTFRKRYPKYKVLPPMDLWPNMLPTLRLLRGIRRLTGVEFTIESAYRSLEVNRKSGGAVQSAHLDFSGIDIVPKSNQKKVEAFVKHYWHEHGSSIQMGLGYYHLNRFHIDTKKYRKWKFERNPKLWAKRYSEYYSVPLNQLILAGKAAEAVETVAGMAVGAMAAAASPMAAALSGFCHRTEMCQYDDAEE